MKQPVPRSRNISQISSTLDKHLNLYTLAASAAGVGLLAFAQPSEAEVVYTPTHVTFKAGTSYFLDINNDGTADFQLNDIASQFGAGLSVHPWGNNAPTSNGVEIGHGSLGPLALNGGAAIGPGKNFYGCLSCSYGQPLAWANKAGAFGNWANVTNRYMGIKFFVSGVTYYGWARLSVRVNGTTVSGVLTGYAYENIPNHPIRAGQTSGSADESDPDSSSPGTRAPSAEKPISQGPQPGSLGTLALGAQGVPLWRGNELVGGAQ
jgi:hypothetical protein